MTEAQRWNPQWSQAGDDADVVCQHGTACDVHCCNCHHGFLFTPESCVCEFDGDDEPESIPVEEKAA